MTRFAVPMRATALAAALAMQGCTTESRVPARGDSANAPLAVVTERRTVVATIGSDSLGQGARLTRLVAEPDGEAIVFVFADSTRRITSGLGIADRRSGTTQLLWPDSVTAAWWTDPHTLAFSAGSTPALRVIVDVHARQLEVVERGAGSPPAPLPAAGDSVEIIARVTRYLDSLHQQPAGQPVSGALRYQAAAMHPSPDRRFAAVYSVAVDGTGNRSNPSWLMVAAGGDAVALVDEVTGPVAEMPDGAATWSRDGAFFYAKGLEIRQATPRASAGTSPGS